MRALVLLIVWLITATVLTQSPARGQSKPLPNTPAKSEWAWTTMQWTRSDSQMSTYRDELKKLLGGRTGANAVAFLLDRAAPLKASFLKQPTDAILFFKWASIEWWLCNESIGGGEYRESPSGTLPLRYFASFDAYCDSYEFSRLRFLYMAMDFPAQPLVPLGKRLFKRNPLDRPVKSTLASSCRPRSKDEEELGKRLANELVKEHPTRAGYWTIYGMQYYLAWRKHRKEADRLLAIKGYEKYLSLAGKQAWFAQSAQEILRELKAPKR